MEGRAAARIGVRARDRAMSPHTPTAHLHAHRAVFLRKKGSDDSGIYIASFGMQMRLVRDMLLMPHLQRGSRSLRTVPHVRQASPWHQTRYQ